MKELSIKKIFVNVSEYVDKKTVLFIRRVLSSLSPILFSLIIARKSIFLSAFPLGLSLIASARDDTLFFFIGTLIFAIYKNNVPLMLGALSLILLRFVFSKIFDSESNFSYKTKLKEKILGGKKPFYEGQTLKLATASLSAFTMGCMQIVLGGFSFIDLAICCFCIILCPMLCYFYSGYFTSAQKQGFKFESGLIALLSTFIFAISDLTFLGVSVAVISASFISFILAKRKNPYSACLFALLSILFAYPSLAAAFALASALSAFLYRHSKFYSVCLGILTFAFVTYLCGGVYYFISFFPEFIIGATLSLAVNESLAERFLPFVGSDTLKKSDADSEILGYKEKKNRENIKDISSSFDALSKAFFELSDKSTRLNIFDTRHICDRVCDKYCRKCDMVSLCWDRDYPVTLDTLNRISAKIYKTGRVTKEDLSDDFIKRCGNIEKLLDDIENENRRVIKSILKEDKTRAFAVDYAVFSRVLSEALDKNEAEYAPNFKARQDIVASLEKIGFYADNIGVYGMRCKNVYAFRIGKGALKCKAEDIKKAISESLCGNVEDPIFEFCDGGINMICKQSPLFETKCSSFSFAAEKENGDRVSAFEGKNGYYYALVNDGMGSGRAAAKKSAAASLFLEKMLRAGNSAASGIEMLAALARADGEEGFTTLDLFEFDKITGKASFIKSGAAPSFVKRGTKLFKIRSKTFPLGILEDVDAERTTFECEDGDKIIILSDGVTEDIEEPLWLCEFLSKIDLSATDAAEQIISEAKAHTLCRDDMTAAVISVSKICGDL